MRGGGEPPVSWAGRQVEYRGPHSCVLPSQYKEGWDLNLNKHDSYSGAEIHTLGLRKDCRFGFTPLGLMANDVLFGRVHVTYSVCLKY